MKKSHSMTKMTAPDTRWYTDALAADPGKTLFHISSADELAGLAGIVNGTAPMIPRDSFSRKTVRLTANIDLSPYKNWKPIGNPRRPFEGTFDGGGHEIRNLTINHPNSDNQGFFGSIESGGTVENVRLVCVNILGCRYVGAVAGNLGGCRGVDGNTDDGKASAVNCSVDGNVCGKVFIGGIAGCLNRFSRVIGCSSGCTVSGNLADELCLADPAVGGVAGVIFNGSEVERCRFTGKVRANYGYLGGVVGLVAYFSHVSNCYSVGEVHGEGSAICVGGIAGCTEDGGAVNYCYATGAVTGGEETGGIAGAIELPYCITNCAALNPLIKSYQEYRGNTGRITGKKPNDVAYEHSSFNNVAYSGMTVDTSEARPRPGNDICQKSEDCCIITNEVSRNRETVSACVLENEDDGEWDTDDGNDISAASIWANGSIGRRFKAENGWTTEDGKLPGLGAAVKMPRHLQLPEQ